MKPFRFSNVITANMLAIGLTISASISLPIAAQADVGSYLAARQAVFDRSFPEQAYYSGRSLAAHPNDIEFLETHISSKMSLGQFFDVYDVAAMLKAQDAQSQIAAMVLLPKAVQDEDWSSVITLIEADEGVSPLVDGLTKAWAYVGVGDMDAALTQFDVAGRAVEGFEVYSRYNRAVALALVGDFEGGLELLASTEMMVSENAVFARVQMLSQLERNEEAQALLAGLFGETNEPYIRGLHEALERGDTLAFDIVTRVQDGIAGVFQSVAELVDGNLDDGYTLLYARVALELRPDRADYAIIVAGLLERMGHADLAAQALASVAPDSPSYYRSALAHARLLRATDKFDEQIDLLTGLAKEYSDLPDVLTALGDAHRQQDNFGEAAKVYTKVIDMLPDGSRDQWPILYARGTTYERHDQWTLAEADFRKALEINPGHPDILNYMGYAFLEMNTNLDEAMDMIRAAVEAKPDDGYITDSLAWGLFQLGQYDDAVQPMERAAQLMPVDPIVNDHLGDVYWAVGRTREAEFQWNRALSFEPEEDEAERIRQKLLIGLDEVLMLEGMDPTREIARQ
jgi:tetratricopeptide (TPR) repeat protein